MNNQYRSIDVSLIPNPDKDIPKMNQLSIAKKSIENVKSFGFLINMFNLIVISNEADYYILDGARKDLEEFQSFWNYSE